MPVDNQETLLEFPCQFPVKAMGPCTDEFTAHVLEIVRKHAPAIGEGSVKCNPSGKGKYQSVTCTIKAENQQQLDAIYQDLTASDQVIMSL